MKFFILSLLGFISAVPQLLPAAINPTLASVPEKLRHYQNATRMSDDSLLALFKRSLAGELSNDRYLF